MAEQIQINSSLDIYNFCAPSLKDKEHEEMWVLCINSLGLVKKIVLSKGGRTCTYFDGALFAKAILKVKYVQAIAIVHNHPSGKCQPSDKDKKVTQQAKGICELLDFQFLDHVIVARNSYYSFADEGLV